MFVHTKTQHLHELLDHVRQPVTRDSFEPPKEHKVFPHCKQVEKRIVLGAISDEPADSFLLCEYVFAAKPRITGAR